MLFDGTAALDCEASVAVCDELVELLAVGGKVPGRGEFLDVRGSGPIRPPPQASDATLARKAAPSSSVVSNRRGTGDCSFSMRSLEGNVWMI